MEFFAQTGSYINQIVAFIVYIGSFMAIPFVAKRFSGALGQMTNMVNDRSKGLFDKMKGGLRSAETNRKKRVMDGRLERRSDLGQRIDEGDPSVGRFRQASFKASEATQETVERVKGGGPLIPISSIRLPGGKRINFRGRADTLERSKHYYEAKQEETIQKAKEQAMSHLEFANRNLEWPDFSKKLAEIAGDGGNRNGAQRQAALTLLSQRGEDELLRQISRAINSNQNDAIGSGAWRRTLNDFHKNFKEMAPDIGFSGVNKAGVVELNNDKFKDFGDQDKTKFKTDSWRAFAKADPEKFAKTCLNVLTTQRLKNNVSPENQAWMASQLPTQDKLRLDLGAWQSGLNQSNLNQAIKDIGSGKTESMARDIISGMAASAQYILSNRQNLSGQVDPRVLKFLQTNQSLINQVNQSFGPTASPTQIPGQQNVFNQSQAPSYQQQNLPFNQSPPNQQQTP